RARCRPPMGGRWAVQRPAAATAMCVLAAIAATGRRGCRPSGWRPGRSWPGRRGGRRYCRPPGAWGAGPGEGRGRPDQARGAPPDGVTAAMSELELAPGELDAAWRVAAGTGMLCLSDNRAAAGARVDVLVSGDAEQVLAVWDDALALMLRAEDLDGMATALYT